MKNIIEFLKKNYLLFIIIICLVITGFILESVYEKEILEFDKLAFSLFKIRTPLLTKIFLIITNLGSPYVLILLTLLSFLLKNKKLSFIITGNLGLITIINQVLKFIVKRPRPSDLFLIVETGYSFPSGHSMVSLSFYGLLIYFIYKYFKNKNLKIFLITLLSLIIILIGISRVYLGVHFVSDVISGFLLSLSYLIIFIKVINKFILKESYEK
ncbi:MAG: phosphatase PAP2 family protein [Erysipelotrichaceae bacterium]|nr:phosphatase PAP2 family protein [Erysipelotrichaceae bacterium]